MQAAQAVAGGLIHQGIERAFEGDVVIRNQAAHRLEDQDRQQGHTRLGPHRADFTVRIADQAAALSRGQQKLLVIALVLAQAELYRRHVGDACILLIDDLPAELDPDNRSRVMQTLAELDTQLFVTAIEPGLLDAALWREARTLRLAHGEMSEVV